VFVFTISFSKSFSIFLSLLSLFTNITFTPEYFQILLISIVTEILVIYKVILPASMITFQFITTILMINSQIVLIYLTLEKI
jgi:hypothetical protein